MLQPAVEMALPDSLEMQNWMRDGQNGKQYIYIVCMYIHAMQTKPTMTDPLLLSNTHAWVWLEQKWLKRHKITHLS